MSKSLTNKVVKFLALFSGSGVLLLSLTFPLVGIGAFTEQINYQGKLTNTAGSAVTDGNYSIAFTLYNASSGGSSVWTETQTVAVANGLFSVMLGSVASLSSVDFNQALYLTINVNGDGEMSPRKLISAVPNALNSNKFGGLATTSFLRSDITNATATITNLNSQYLSVNGSLSVFGTTTNYLGGGSYISLDSFSILGLGDIPIITSRADSDAILGSDLNILGVADRLWIKETDGLSDIGLSFYDNSLTSVAGFSVATSTKYFTFSDANSWTFRSTGPGNDPLTINTANSSVSIGTTTNFSNSFYVNATSTFEGLSTFTGESTFTNNVTFPHMFINSANGGIGIGTTTPDSFSLSVNSTSTFYQDTTFYGDIVSRPYSNNIKIIGGENVLLPSSARNVFVYGHYAYVVSYPAPSGSHGLRIIDISDPKNPKNTGELELELPEAIASRVRVVGNYAYVSFFADLISGTPNAGFRIIDVTDKYNPKVVSGVGVSTSVGSEHSCMEVSGKYMYLCSDNGGIEVIDISDPYGPFVAGAITGLPIKPWDIKINKNRLYYATKNDLTGSALRVLDISNPTNPVVLGGSNLDSDFDSTMIWSMDYANDYLYIAMGYDFGEPAGANHFRIIDVSSSTNPVIVGGENLVFGDGTANYVKVAGNRAYVSQWNTQFSVIDVSSSTNPYFITETISNTYGGNTIISFDFYGKYIVAGYSYVPWPGPNYNNFRILEIGGMDVGTANIGVLETDNLGVGKNALFGGLLSVLGLLRSYGGLISDGSLAVLSTTSPSYFAGFLGIGTTSPMEELTVVGDARFQTGATSSLTISEFDLSGSLKGPLLTGYADSDALLGLDVNFVGLADRALILEQDGLSDLSFTFVAGDGTTASSFSVATSTKVFTFGNSLTWTFENADTASATLKIDVDNNQVSLDSLTTNGAVYSNNGILTNVNPSSRDYKSNITETELNIDALLNLQVKAFTWNTNNQNDFGLIAEEIQEALPELYVDNGQVKGYRADHLPFYLLQIAQRQAKQITDLDNRIASGTINFSSTTDTLSLTALQSLTGTWSISADGILTVKKVVAEQLMVEDGVTVKDKATGGYTCIYVENGTIKTSAGECGSGIISEPTPTPPPSEEPATPEPSPEEPAVEPTPEEPTPDIPPEPTPEPPPAEEPTPPAEPPAPPVESPASPVG